MLAAPDNKYTDEITFLLSDIAQGDELAMGYFYARHQGQIFAYANSRLKHYEDAVEIVNEVMLDVWRSKNRFKNKSKFTTWLFGIAHHKVVDKIRKNERHEKKSILDIETEVGYVPASDDLFERYQDKCQVTKAMKSLNHTQRYVLYLSFYKDMSYSEIADALGCPVGTVKSRVMHAKNKVRSELGR
jgi:RNA polymerase sigma-70 factor (ECF subfamily)